MINIEKVKIKIIQALKPLKPEKIILFGSYAYGTPTENSDLDICIIEKAFECKWEEKSKIRKCLKNIKIEKDILLETSDYFEKYSDVNWINTALYDAKKYGKILYEKQ